MSKQGAALQTYNNELVRCLEELCERRSALQREIDVEEAEKSEIEEEMVKLNARLDRAERSLAEKREAKARYDRTIGESEQAYFKIVESSQVLLNVVKKDAKALGGNRGKDRRGEGS